MKLYTLYRSSNPKKKYDVFVDNHKTGRVKKISFGASGHEDFTTHRDVVRRQRYRSRHRNDKNDDYLYAGFWASRVLWGDSTNIDVNMREAVKDIKR